MGNKKLNRETYLEVAKAEISTLFKSKGYPFKAKDLKGIKVTTSFPTSGGQSASAPIGLCCYAYNSNTEILISPVLGGKTIDESIEVLAVLTHELVHAYLGAGFGHGREFKKIATSVGLTGRMTTTTAGEEFKKWAKETIKKLGNSLMKNLTWEQERNNQLETLEQFAILWAVIPSGTLQGLNGLKD